MSPTSPLSLSPKTPSELQDLSGGFSAEPHLDSTLARVPLPSPPAASSSVSSWHTFRRDHQHTLEFFLAGGCAGATSRTAVSPLERLKIMMQVQSHHPAEGAKGSYNGIVSGLTKMWKEEGFKGYMRGNGINVLRIFPYSAVQFTTYESCKQLFTSDDGHLGTAAKLLAGSLAGITSVCSTYPLDLVRARISISAAQNSATSRAQQLGIVGMTLKVYREEGGLAGLYRGTIPTAIGVAPFVALNFYLYERFRLYALPPEIEHDASESRAVLTKLGCGALAGGLSQTITYPFDVIRRKMQVVGLQRSRPTPLPSSLATSSSSSPPSSNSQISASPSLNHPHNKSSSSSFTSSLSSRTKSSSPASSLSSHGLLLSPSTRGSSSSSLASPSGYTYTSGSGALIQIFQREGLRGLYRGIGPNLLKVAPSMGVSFYTYETVLSLIRSEDD